MVQTQKQVLGKNGEKAARAYLEKKGQRIIETNYRTGRSELDIISHDETTLVVTEVKSFYARPLGVPEARVNKRKQQQIIRAVYGFLDENPKYQGYNVRLDVIIVDFSQYPAQIQHHKGAFFEDDAY